MTQTARVFKGLSADDGRRLNEVVDEINEALKSTPNGMVLNMGAAGRPFNYALPLDITDNELMLAHLAEGFTEGCFVKAEVVYSDRRPQYLKITRLVGA